MYENYTLESIKADILDQMTSTIDKREGSFTNDMISAVAYEIWKVYQSLDGIVPIAFVDETSGQYIDRRCLEYGITRKSGTKSTAAITLSGTDGTVIPEGKVFQTADGLQFVNDMEVTIIDGTANSTVTAVEIGEEYNVDAGTITLQIVSLSGLTAVTNEQATGGTAPETDAALVARLYDFLQNTATSGNTSHYRQWALSVDGVGAAKVTPLWNGAGTVKVLVVGSDNQPVDSTIVDACAAHIKDNRPIGAEVTVISASGLSINIATTISIDSSTNVEAVQTEFSNTLDTYLKSIAFSQYTLVYNRIAYMLLDIDGVIDYSLLTINEGTENITIDDDEVPVVGTIEVSV